MNIKNKELDPVIHMIKFLAKITFNLRYDLNELKLKLVEAFKSSGNIDPEEIYLAYPNDIQKEIKRINDEYFT